MNSANTCFQDTFWLSGDLWPAHEQISLAAPRADEERWVRLNQWHSYSADSCVWILYTPPESQCNGWGEAPHELDKSFIVECFILNFAPFWFVERPDYRRPSVPVPFDRTPMRARRKEAPFRPDNWPHFSSDFEVYGPAFVRCYQAIALADIPLHFPEEAETFRLDDFGYHRTVHEQKCQSDRLIYQSRGVEGARDWCIRTNETPSRVVLHAFEIVGQGRATICNRVFEK